MGTDNTKNKMEDLNDHLFTEMERLCDDRLKGEKLQQEVVRSKAVASIATQIINNARVVLAATIAINEGLITKPPRLLGIAGYEEEKEE